MELLHIFVMIMVLGGAVLAVFLLSDAPLDADASDTIRTYLIHNVALVGHTHLVECMV